MKIQFNEEQDEVMIDLTKCEAKFMARILGDYYHMQEIFHKMGINLSDPTGSGKYDPVEECAMIIAGCLEEQLKKLDIPTPSVKELRDTVIHLVKEFAPDKYKEMLEDNPLMMVTSEDEEAVQEVTKEIDTAKE